MDAIPVVDYLDFERDRPKFLRALKHALADVGFMVLINNPDFEPDFQQRVLAESHAFFDASDAVKASVDIALSPHYRGWSSGKEFLGQKLEAFQYSLELPGGHHDDPNLPLWTKIGYGPNLWPDPSALPGFRPAVEVLRTRYLKLGHELCRAICESLGHENEFEKYFDVEQPVFVASANHNYGPGLLERQTRSEVKEQYEHASTADTDSWVFETLGRGGAHVDGPPFITMLIADKPGLQVLVRKDTWVDFPMIPGAVAVNVGTCLQHLSSGRMVATVHRANTLLIPENETRVSLPFFLLPKLEGNLIPFGMSADASDENWTIKKDRDRATVAAFDRMDDFSESTKRWYKKEFKTLKDPMRELKISDTLLSIKSVQERYLRQNYAKL